MIETEERVVEVVREVPVEIVKEVPVYVKVDAAEWDARHGLTARTRSQYGGIGMLVSDPRLLLGVSARTLGDLRRAMILRHDTAS